MRLTDLHGNTLKVYLRLVESCDAQDRCALSQRVLSRQVGLSRQATDRAFAQLQQQRWIVRHGSEWGVDATPARAFFQRLTARFGAIDPGEEAREHPPEAGVDAAIAGLKTRPAATGSGLENRPAGGLENRPGSTGGGLKTRPVAAEGGLKTRPVEPSGLKTRPTHSAPLTRARTFQSSSYEEDNICTAVPPSSSSSSLLLPSSGEGRGEEGGLGGENPDEEKKGGKTSPGEEEKNTPEEGKENPGAAKKRKLPPSMYLSQMQSWWDAIWPDNLEEEIPWFGQLWEEFGEEIPVQALRQFAESGRKLTDLDYPKRFQRYFRTCCRNAQQGSPPPPEKSSSPPASRPSSKGDGRYSAAAEPAPESASDTGGTPVLTDVSAEEVQLKEDLVNHMATFWANQADTPHTRSADHFLASFRTERRRP